jgi:hypothetical protein
VILVISTTRAVDPDTSPHSTCRVDPLAAVTVARLGPTKAQAVAAWVSAPALLDGGGAALDDGAGSVVVAAAGHRWTGWTRPPQERV